MASPEHVSFEAFEFFQKEEERDKEAHAQTACMVWILSGLYLYATTPGASLFSFSALGFFIIGANVASILMGRAGYLMRRAMAAVLVETVGFPGLKMAAAISGLGLLLFVAEVVAGYDFTKALFQHVIAT